MKMLYALSGSKESTIVSHEKPEFPVLLFCGNSQERTNLSKVALQPPCETDYAASTIINTLMSPVPPTILSPTPPTFLCFQKF